MHCQDIMPVLFAQDLDDIAIEVLVRKKPGHEASRLFIFADRLVDFLGMFPIVVPRGLKISRGEVWVAPENLMIGQANLAPLHQPPYGMPGVTDSGVTPTHTNGLLDPARGELCGIC
jgi:hypothetical protein